MKANVTLFWKEPLKTARGSEILASVKENVEIEEGLTVLTITEAEGKYSRIPLASLAYYDVEEIDVQE